MLIQLPGNLKLTASLHLKIDGWKLRNFSLWGKGGKGPIFRDEMLVLGSVVYHHEGTIKGSWWLRIP